MTVIIILIITVVKVIVYYYTKFETTVTIKDKYIRYRKNDSGYHVVDEDGTIYQIGNLWFNNDFNRAEDYNSLEKGKTYNVKGFGYRFAMLDSYKIIYEIIGTN